MVAISAVGVWLSDDRGASWRHSNNGIVPEYLPEEALDIPISALRAQRPAVDARPERLFMQFHGGVYRSDDAGASWIDVGDGTDLPSDFGFPIVVDPADPDSAYVIPLSGPRTGRRRKARCGSGRRATPAPPGPRAATGFPVATRT